MGDSERLVAPISKRHAFDPASAWAEAASEEELPRTLEGLSVMLTMFTTPKPFRGHIGVIQRNALKSWTLLHPDLEVILFGDDEGAAVVAGEFGLRHEPHVERNEFGTNRLDSMFG